MLTTSSKLSGRALPTLTLLAVILLVVASACAHSPPATEAEPETTEQAEPETARPDDPTGAATEHEIEKRPREPVESFLQSRFPGVLVTTNADGSLSIRIRGATSFMAGTEPLYVIDGTPVRPELGGGLIGINPYDIESIKVLKGPPSTSLYGVRGANGVVLITTRRP